MERNSICVSIAFTIAFVYFYFVFLHFSMSLDFLELRFWFMTSVTGLTLLKDYLQYQNPMKVPIFLLFMVQPHLRQLTLSQLHLMQTSMQMMQ